MTFGEKLKYYRKQAGLTQTQLAEAADLSLNTISNYEKGNTYPKDRGTYETLAKVLGVDPDELKSEGKRLQIGIIGSSPAIGISHYLHQYQPRIIDDVLKMLEESSIWSFDFTPPDETPKDIKFELSRQINKMVFHKAYDSSKSAVSSTTTLSGEPEIDDAVYKIAAFLKDTDVSGYKKAAVLNYLEKSCKMS